MGHSFLEKETLYNQNPYCHWCKKLMHLYRAGDIKQYEQIPDDAATVEHIYPHGSNQRKWYKKNHIRSPIVLACLRCNGERGCMPYEKFKEKMDEI